MSLGRCHVRGEPAEERIDVPVGKRGRIAAQHVGGARDRRLRRGGRRRRNRDPKRLGGGALLVGKVAAEHHKRAFRGIVHRVGEGVPAEQLLEPRARNLAAAERIADLAMLLVREREPHLDRGLVAALVDDVPEVGDHQAGRDLFDRIALGNERVRSGDRRADAAQPVPDLAAKAVVELLVDSGRPLDLQPERALLGIGDRDLVLGGPDDPPAPQPSPAWRRPRSGPAA